MSGIPTLFVTVGPPGSGKSTLCRRLAEKGVVWLSRDELRKEFGDYSSEKRIQEMKLLEAKVCGNLLNGKSVVVDANHVSIDQRAEVLLWPKQLWLMHQTRVRKVLLWLPSTREESLERRQAKIESGELPEKVIHNQHNKLTPPTIHEGAHVVIADAHTSPLDGILHGFVMPFDVINLLGRGDHGITEPQ